MAEIELVLMMPLLLVFLFMIIATMRLHDARQRAHAESVARAWHYGSENSFWLNWNFSDFGFMHPFTWPMHVELEVEDTPETLELDALPIHVSVAEQTERPELYISAEYFETGKVYSTSAIISPAWTYLDNETGTGFSMNAYDVRHWYKRLGKYSNAGLEKSLRLAED